jgi:hypothetical protein
MRIQLDLDIETGELDDVVATIAGQVRDLGASQVRDLRAADPKPTAPQEEAIDD